MTPIPAPEILDALQWRYATKVFDASKKIPAETWSALEESLVLTPSSYGLQPWKFLVITDQALRESIVPFAWRQRQVADCSHLVVFCSRTTLGEEDVDKFMNRITEVRGGTADALMGYKKVILGDVVTGERSKFVGEWAARQAYIALGQFMMVAALAGVDTCPMEGFEVKAVDELLGLPAIGLTAAVMCPAGYRAESDRYADLPKVRFSGNDMVERR
jgi:nitroreductase